MESSPIGENMAFYRNLNLLFRALRFDLCLSMTWIFYLKLYASVILSQGTRWDLANIGSVQVWSVPEINSMFVFAFASSLVVAPIIITYILVKLR